MRLAPPGECKSVVFRIGILRTFNQPRSGSSTSMAAAMKTDRCILCCFSFDLKNLSLCQRSRVSANPGDLFEAYSAIVSESYRDQSTALIDLVSSRRDTLYWCRTCKRLLSSLETGKRKVDEKVNEGVRLLKSGGVFAECLKQKRSREIPDDGQVKQSPQPKQRRVSSVHPTPHTTPVKVLRSTPQSACPPGSAPPSARAVRCRSTPIKYRLTPRKSGISVKVVYISGVYMCLTNYYTPVCLN